MVPFVRWLCWLAVQYRVHPNPNPLITPHAQSMMSLWRMYLRVLTSFGLYARILVIGLPTHRSYLPDMRTLRGIVAANKCLGPLQQGRL